MNIELIIENNYKQSLCLVIGTVWEHCGFIHIKEYFKTIENQSFTECLITQIFTMYYEWENRLAKIFNIPILRKICTFRNQNTNKQNTDDAIVEILFSFWGSLLKIFNIGSIHIQNKHNFQSWMWTFKMLYGKKILFIEKVQINRKRTYITAFKI